jgi:BTB/POZ domain-containing protein 9
MFFCGLRETTDKEVELKDTPVAAFKAILGYVYTGRLRLADLKEDVVLDTLGLAHQYEFPELEASIAEYLQSILNVDNVCVLYDAASLYGQGKLEQTCLQFMDRNASQVLRHESFLHLSEASLSIRFVLFSFSENDSCSWLIKD